MKGSVVLIIIVLALVGLFAYSYFNPETQSSGTQQTFQEKVAKAGGLVEKHPVDFKEKARELAMEAEEKAAQVAQNAAQTAEAQKENIDQLNMQIKDTTASMQAKMETAAAEAKAMAGEMTAKVQTMIQEARALLEQGEYQQASQKAQGILAIDPESGDAKDILTQAKDKIAAIAKQSTEKFQTELTNKAEDAKAALMGVGQ